MLWERSLTVLSHFSDESQSADENHPLWSLLTLVLPHIVSELLVSIFQSSVSRGRMTRFLHTIPHLSPSLITEFLRLRMCLSKAYHRISMSLLHLERV